MGARPADPATGRVDLSDFKQGAGDRGGFGYDDNGSPDLGAFAYTEVEADRAGPALFLIGSSGTLIVTVNEQPVYQYNNSAGRAYAPGTDLVRFELAKGNEPHPGRLPARDRAVVLSGSRSRGSRRGRGNDPTATARSKRFAVSRSRTRAIPKRERRSSSTPRESAVFDVIPRPGRGGSTIGPDLTGLAAKYDRAEVIRSILEPSHRIATGYQPVIVATRDGKVATGVVRSETDTTLELADSEAKITKIPKSDIEVRRVGMCRSCRRSWSRPSRRPSSRISSVFCSASSSPESSE